MKVCTIQPPYSRDTTHSDEYFTYKMNLLDECDNTLDLIVLPEYSDVPCATATWEETLFCHEKYLDTLKEKCRAAAIRCQAIVCVNALSREETGYRNTTFVYSRQGFIIGKYFKKHLAPSEINIFHLDNSYTLEPSEPYVLEIEGIRYGFLTCYDFYFYEAFANLALQNLDIIIGCSLQRSDNHNTIETICRFLAYNTNAYVIRSSVSFQETSNVCGASMIVSPDGTVLENMHGRFGKAVVEFDPREKYYKSAGFGNSLASHYMYMEQGRQPWQYRQNGSAIVPFDHLMKYPRICAHRGFNTIAPENSLPAFGAAIALGAEEIEFDLWPTKDGKIVSCHDDTLERVSDGWGKVYEHTYEELKRYDFGQKFGEKFKGLRIVLFEHILKKFAGQAIMNIHVKPLGDSYDPEIMKKIVALIHKYDCAKHVYFMLEPDDDIRMFKAYAPDIKVCVGHDPNRKWEIVERAIELGAEKVQFFKPYVNRKMIDKAHSHGIICNVFWSDDPSEAQEFLKMGIDTILTNDYHLVSQILKTDE